MRLTLSINPSLADLTTLRRVIQESLRGEECLLVESLEPGLVNVRIELDNRDAETVKDVVYEALLVHLDPEYPSDIEVELNTEL